jgi:uncharacterized protein (DUF2062 family)
MVKKRSCFVNIFRRLRINYLKIYNARGSSQEIALGADIGAFWGVFPTFGLSTVLSFLLYKVLRFNFPVALAAAFISNPITSPFFLLISYKLGTLFIETDIQFDSKNWLQNFSQLVYILLIGSTIISSITAILVHFIVKYAIDLKQKVNNQAKQL